MTKNKYKTVFISDVHLGSRACQAEVLCEFLKHSPCETLYLVGDIIDFWKLNRGVYWPQSHSNVIRRILTASKRGTSVKYVIGNHDEQLRQWFGDLTMVGNIEIANHFDHVLSNGSKMLITHGDLFDDIMLYHKWLGILGDQAYTFLIWFNVWFNRLRKLCGKDYYSISNLLKTNTKQAVAFITKFEDFLCEHAKEKDYSAVLCGHIHSPDLREDERFVYMNTGDFCETISAIVENFDGSFDLLVWNSSINAIEKTKSWSPSENINS